MEEERKYDPKYAHEYYMKHRKLKGRKKKKSSSKKKSPRKLSIKTQIKNLMASLNDAGARAAEIELQKLENDKQELNQKLKEKWNAKIKEIKERIKNASEEEKEALKTELATMQVDYKAEKKIVKDYFEAQSLNIVAQIASNKDMKK